MYGLLYILTYLLEKSLLELEVVYSVSFKCYKVFSLKMKKKTPKRCEPLKKRDKKDIEKRGKMKNEKYKKSVTT